jgi:hypothetical protein
VTTDFKDKFISFVDVLGYKQMVEAAEAGTGRTSSELDEILTLLERKKDKEFFAAHGPQWCPQSAYVRKDLDFEITQVSDCVIASAEVSPAGVVNLVNHAWGAAIMLLTKGVMVRGYVTRGSIQHEGMKFRGTGYHTAYSKEGSVTAFKKEADEKGTPFIEIDPTVTDYVDNHSDECVKKMFCRMVKREGDVAAIFPFQALSHSFIVGDYAGQKFDPEKQKRSNNAVRKNLQRFKEGLLKFVASRNDEGMQKVRHYLEALDEQLRICDRTDEFIDALCRPLPGRTLGDLLNPRPKDP